MQQNHQALLALPPRNHNLEEIQQSTHEDGIDLDIAIVPGEQVGGVVFGEGRFGFGRRFRFPEPQGHDDAACEEDGDGDIYGAFDWATVFPNEFHHGQQGAGRCLVRHVATEER